MNKPFWLGLSLVLLSSAGCFSLPAEPFASKVPPVAPLPTINAPPPVTVDQILASGENGHDIADRLEKELDRESQRSLLNTMPRSP